MKMKKQANTIMAAIALVASASVSADDISSVISRDQVSVVESSVSSRQVEFAPITIQDYIERANAKSGSDVGVNTQSVVINGWEDVIGNPVRL